MSKLLGLTIGLISISIYVDVVLSSTASFAILQITPLAVLFTWSKFRASEQYLLAWVAAVFGSVLFGLFMGVNPGLIILSLASANILANFVPDVGSIRNFERIILILGFFSILQLLYYPSIVMFALNVVIAIVILNLNVFE